MEQPAGGNTPKAPRKRAASKQPEWSPATKDTVQQRLESLEQHVQLLQERLHSFEEGTREALEHLCQVMDSTEDTDEEEMN